MNQCEKGLKCIKSHALLVKIHIQPGCPHRGNMAMSLQLVIQTLVGRENLVPPKALTLSGRKRRRRRMKPVGLDAFKKNEVTCLGEMPSDNDPAAVVEMMKKRVPLLHPQP